MKYTATQEEENKEIANRYKNLLKGTYQVLSEEDKTLIRSAFELAVEAHSKQRRKSGEPYIYHPIAVAKIVADEIGLSATSIAAALLHDVVEDTDYTIEDMERIFGKTIAKIVSGLTKISSFKKDKNYSLQAENFRKMLLTLHDDVRVILIKIADRLHNMQTMDSMPAHKQAKIASETLYVYAPMAHRLGLFNIKTELEDLGLKYTEPEVYKGILSKIKGSHEEREAYLEAFKDKIKEVLDKENFNYEIKGRYKSIYSISKKMKKQNVPFKKVYDKYAIRIVYDSTNKNEKFNAWKIYSIVTDFFKPNPARLRDWITHPKSTGYEALHTTVIGPQNKWVEVQIRSKRMDEIAEKGYAAHFKYKQSDTNENGLEGWLNRLKDTLESNETNAVDFVEDFKLNLYSKEIYVFTPKGDLKSLPKGASALDFAFAIHTGVGLKTRGAIVNGKLVPLSHRLQSGDQIEILTSSTNKPNSRWLNFVITARAKSKIKTALKAEEKAIADEGKDILKRKLKHLKIDYTDKVVHELANYLGLKTSFELFFGMGNGTIENTKLKEFANQRNRNFIKFFKNPFKKEIVKSTPAPEIDTKKLNGIVFGDNEDKLDYSIAKCCKPVAGDKIFGFLTIREGIKIHKSNCPNAVALHSNYAYRIMKAKWIDTSNHKFSVTLKIIGINKDGIVNEMLQVMGSMGVLLTNINIDSKEGYFEGQISVIVKNNEQLNEFINTIKKNQGVQKVIRINNL